MSLESAQKKVSSLESEIAKLEQDKQAAEKKEADELNKASKITISKNASPTAIRSKKKQIASHNNAANTARDKKINIGKKIISKTKELNTAKDRLRKAEVSERNKQIKEMSIIKSNLDNRISESQLIKDTRDCLQNYDKALALYDKAISKFEDGDPDDARNVLDDMRLALEQLIRQILGNEKSLENQKEGLGAFLKGAKISSEIRNLITQTMSYYTRFQDNHVKHDDSFHELELEYIIDQTSVIMKFLATVNGGEYNG